MEATITPREGLKERDVKHHMGTARKRFKLDKKASVANAMQAFRSWARKTYLGIASTGKLLDIVRGRDPRTAPSARGDCGGGEPTANFLTARSANSKAAALSRRRRGGSTRTGYRISHVAFV